MSTLKESMETRVYSVMKPVITRITSNLDQRAAQTVKIILFHSALYVMLKYMSKALKIMLKRLGNKQS